MILMRYSKICFLICIVLFFISISCVSAEVVNETVNNLSSISDDFEVSDEVYLSSQDEEVISANEGSYWDLYSQISGSSSSLSLSKDYKFDSSNFWDTYSYFHLYDGVSITKSITINGNGHSIDGDGQARIFSITASNVVLKNIVFKNALYDHGGAIYWKALRGTVSNCTFINCTAYDGAAIFGLNTSLTIENSKFLENYAYFSGGAVYQMYGSLSVNNCYFYSNGANDGGAIGIDAYNSLKIINSNFTYNYAYRYGGAVATSFNSVLTCTNCKFNFNEAYKGDDVYNILLSEILDTSSDVNSLIQYFPDEVTSFPEYYNLRNEGYLTPIKNQGTDGNCWAFAAMAALESALLKATGVSYDFSENNLKNLAAKFSDYGKNIEVNDGGNYWMAISYFASWLGPINESYDPYADDGNLFSDFFMPLLHMHIQDVAFVKRTSVSDLNVIKKAIMMYGAVATNFHSDSKYTSGANIYCPDDLSTNHAVAIVGWNDTYSKNNFKTTPEGDGAWIIKNSWGSNNGDNGYYYISYYDKTLALDKHGYSYVFVFNNTVDYEKIYQHEFIRTSNFWWDSAEDNINESQMVKNTIWFKNIYTAKDDEFLAAVSTWFDYDMTFDMTINVTHNGKSSVYSQTSFTKAGYHTIKLNKYIPLQKGDTFSITFKFKGIYWFAAYDDSLGLRNFSTPGISYSSWNGVDWRDLYDYNDVASSSSFSSICAVNSTLTILNFDSPKVSDSFNVAVRVTDQFGNLVNNGNVTFMFNNTRYVLNTTDGIANLTLKLNKSGIYNLNCTFNAHNYYSSTNSLQFQVLKHTSDLIVNVNNINYNQNLTVNVTLSSNATGKVFIKIDDSNKANVTVKNNNASYTFSNLKAGNYKLNVTYYGDEYYYSISKNTTFKVNKISSSVAISNIASVIYGNNLNISYSITDGATGNINVSIYKNNILINSNLTNKKSISFSNLDAGTYTVIVKYLGDNNFLASNKSSIFTILKATSSISINGANNIFYGEVINIVPNLVNGTSGNYTLLYNSNILKTGLLTKNIQFNDLNAGNYTLALINFGDANHNSSNASVKFEVFKINSNLNIAPISAVTYGNDLIVSVTLHSSYTGYVKVSIFKDNKLISNKTVNNLNAIFKNLNAGEYNVTVEILNDTNYYNTFVKTFAYVNKANSNVGVVAPLNITYGDDFTANISLINATNSIYNLYYNNNLLKSGNASSKLTFTNLNYGNYILEVINTESNNYKESSHTFSFKVLKSDVILSLNVLNVIYNNNITIPFNINATGNVNVLIYKNKQLIINKTTDVNDKEFKILLNASDYDVVLNYFGDLNHNPSSINSNFIVYKATSSIEIKKLANITYSEDLNIEVTLTNGSATYYELIQNNNIIKTGNNLNIPNLAAGEYTIQITNLGDENHNQSIVKSNFKVNKLMPIITINPINDIIYNKTVIADFNINIPSAINIILLKENILISNQTSNGGSVDFDNLDFGNY